MSTDIFNPEIKDYLKFKGKINTNVFLDMIDVTPHDGQKEVIAAYEARIPATEDTIARGKLYNLPLEFQYKYNVFLILCGRRWGKSVICSDLGTAELMIPNSHVMIVSATTKTCETIFKRIRHTIKHKLKLDLDIDRAKDMELQVKGGGRLTVASNENVENRLGSAVSLLIIDEAKLFHKDLYEQILSPMLMDYFAFGRVLMVSTPQQGWLEPLYNNIINKHPDYLDHFTINSPSSCNPLNSPDFLAKKKATMPPDLFAQEYEAKFTAGAGKVYPEFNRDRNIKQESSYPYLWNWIKDGNITVNSIDSGYSHYFACIYFVYVEEIDTYIVFKEYSKNKTLTKTHAENIITYERENNFEPTLRYADPAAAQQIADLAEYELYYNRSEKNIRESVQLCNSLFYQTSEVTGEPRLVVIDSCHELIRQLNEVSWKESSDSQTYEKTVSGTKPFAPDKSKKTDWDLTDAFRYGVYSIAKNNTANIACFDLDPSVDHEDDSYYKRMAELGYVLNQ